MNLTPKSPERAFALQKYLLLHSQHDALQKHLAGTSATGPTSPTAPRSSPSRTRFSSLSSSPDSNHEAFSSSPLSTGSSYHRQSGSMPDHRQRPAFGIRQSSLPTVFDERLFEEIEENEKKLKDVNLQIKSTLTELLNCKSVGSDRKYRMWVQARLTTTEEELKVSRTRSFEHTFIL